MRNRLTNRQASPSLRREISEDFKYDKKKLKHLQRILHNVNISVGTLVSALNEFSRVKGPAISPDGLLGGLGYIMSVKNIKEILNSSVHNLSDVADSLADELTNPHWHANDKKTKEIIKEKKEVEEKTQEVLDEPENVEDAIEDGGFDPEEKEEVEVSEETEESKSEDAEDDDESVEDDEIKPDEVKNSTEGLIKSSGKTASEQIVRNVLPSAIKAALIRSLSKK